MTGRRWASQGSRAVSRGILSEAEAPAKRSASLTLQPRTNGRWLLHRAFPASVRRETLAYTTNPGGCKPASRPRLWPHSLPNSTLTTQLRSIFLSCRPSSLQHLPGR
jgi:hypothetical protein